jgi:hypothetical protein
MYRVARFLPALVIVAAMSGCVQHAPDENGGAETRGEAFRTKRSDKELILDAVVFDILNDPGLKDTRDFYGTPGDKHLALVTNSEFGVPWPAGYQPNLSGWTFIRVDEDGERDPKEPRLLGIRIDKYYDDDKERAEIFRSSVAMTILNAGGSKNGGVIGGCSVYYTPKQVDGKWVVECEGSVDP